MSHANTDILFHLRFYCTLTSSKLLHTSETCTTSFSVEGYTILNTKCQLSTDLCENLYTYILYKDDNMFNSMSKNKNINNVFGLDTVLFVSQSAGVILMNTLV